MRHRGTITTQGFIPSIKYNGIDLFVKAKTRSRPQQKHCSPVTRDGFVVYALPGGGEHVSALKITEIKA